MAIFTCTFLFVNELSEVISPVQIIHTEKEHQNEHIQLKVQHLPGCKVVFNIEVLPTATTQTYEKAVQLVRKEVSIPGFRVGKAPVETVKKNFLKAINSEFRRLIINLAVSEAVQLSGFRPLSDSSINNVDVKKLDKDEGASLHLEFESQPQSPKLDLEILEIQPVAAKSVTDKDLKVAEKQIQLQYASFDEVSDRAVALGDCVELDIDVIENPAHNVCIDRPFSCEYDEMPKWILDAILGLLVNESKEAKSEQDEEQEIVDTEAPPSQSKLCRITVKSIKKPHFLPEEEFLQKVKLASRAEFLEQVTNQIKAEKEEYAKAMSRYLLRKELYAKYPIDLPRSLVEHEIRYRLKEIEEAHKNDKSPFKFDERKKELMRNQIMDEVVAFFMDFYLLRDLAKEQAFPITNEEIQSEMIRQFAYTAPENRIIFPTMTLDEAKTRIIMKLTIDKSQDYIIQKKA